MDATPPHHGVYGAQWVNWRGANTTQALKPINYVAKGESMSVNGE